MHQSASAASRYSWGYLSASDGSARAELPGQAFAQRRAPGRPALKCSLMRLTACASSAAQVVAAGQVVSGKTPRSAGGAAAMHRGAVVAKVPIPPVRRS